MPTFSAMEPEELLKKLILSVANARERIFNADSFFVGGGTAFDVIHQEDLLTVRHYRPLQESNVQIGNHTLEVKQHKHRVPLVLVPPLLASSLIFDLYPERSLVRYFLAMGFDVYLIDFGFPEKDHSHLSLEDYVLSWIPKSFQRIREHSAQEELSLFGYCMGGLFCLMTTAANDDRQIKNLVTVASPVDMHQMGMAGGLLAMMNLPSKFFARAFNFSLLDLPPQYLHVPGFMGTLAFKLMSPTASLANYKDLILNLWDRQYIEAHMSMSRWVNRMSDYPGAAMQGLLVRMGLANQLARGKLKLGGKSVNLDKIECALLGFAGTNDKVVPQKAVSKLFEVVSSRDKQFCLVPGGHAGVFAGRNAVDNMWVIAGQWLAARSD